jgi:hypothetical protein
VKNVGRSPDVAKGMLLYYMVGEEAVMESHRSLQLKTPKIQQGDEKRRKNSSLNNS